MRVDVVGVVISCCLTRSAMKESNENQIGEKPATSFGSSERAYRCLGLALQATARELNEWKCALCCTERVKTGKGIGTEGRKAREWERVKGIYFGCHVAGATLGVDVPGEHKRVGRVGGVS